MTAEQMTAEFFDSEVLTKLAEQLDSDQIAAKRSDVITNVVGCWAVQGANLPDTLTVPNIIEYESLEELVNQSPEDNVGFICRPYIDEQIDVLTEVLGGFTPVPKIADLIDVTTEAVLLEEDKRLQDYAQIMRALGKPIDPVQDIQKEKMHGRQFIADFIAKMELPTDQPADELVNSVVIRGMLIARIHINIERDLVQQVVESKPTDAFEPIPPTEKTSHLRQWFQQKFLHKKPHR